MPRTPGPVRSVPGVKTDPVKASRDKTRLLLSRKGWQWVIVARGRVTGIAEIAENDIWITVIHTHVPSQKDIVVGLVSRKGKRLTARVHGLLSPHDATRLLLARYRQQLKK